MYRRHKINSGMTLIELLVAAMIFSAVILSSAWLLSVGFKEWSAEQNRIYIRQEGMTAMETMARYIGIAGNYPLLTGGITSATAASVTFLADVNNTGSLQTVTISYASGKVTATVVGASTATVTIAPSVASFSFAYYDGSGASLAVPVSTQALRDSIRVVTVTMAMTKGSDTINYSLSAYCRNNHT